MRFSWELHIFALAWQEQDWLSIQLFAYTNYLIQINTPHLPGQPPANALDPPEPPRNVPRTGPELSMER